MNQKKSLKIFLFWKQRENAGCVLWVETIFLLFCDFEFDRNKFFELQKQMVKLVDFEEKKCVTNFFMAETTTSAMHVESIIYQVLTIGPN